MPLYPTVEDFIVHQYQMAAQNSEPMDIRLRHVQPSAPIYEPSNPHIGAPQSRLYETIDGNEQSPFGASSYPKLPSYYESMAANPPTPVVPPVAILNNPFSLNAPITSLCSGLQKARLTHGIRRIVMTKCGKNEKFGLRVRAINQGIFVQLVAVSSCAAAERIRFGDQILNINGTETAGLSTQKATDMIKKCKEQLVLVIRDRPMARLITLHKDPGGFLGFSHKDNLITAIMKESSASRNGLTVNQRIVEVDGRNVMALKSKDLKACLDEAPFTVTLTLMPTEFYEELIKKMDWSTVRKQDRSEPQI